MAAGEDEPQSIVLDRLFGRARGIAESSDPVRSTTVSYEPPIRAPLSHRVDALEARRGDEPGARVLRHAVAWPLLDGRRERLLHRFLGAVEVAEQPDQRGEHAARFVAVDRLDAPFHSRDAGQCAAPPRAPRPSPPTRQRRDALRDRERVVQVAAFDDVKAAELLLGFRVRAVDDDAAFRPAPGPSGRSPDGASFADRTCWPALSMSATQAP